jgi:hypothetical protein
VPMHLNRCSDHRRTEFVRFQKQRVHVMSFTGANKGNQELGKRVSVPSYPFVRFVSFCKK